MQNLLNFYGTDAVSTVLTADEVDSVMFMERPQEGVKGFIKGNVQRMRGYVEIVDGELIGMLKVTSTHIAQLEQTTVSPSSRYYGSSVRNIYHRECQVL
jgi:hypothetical protein